LHDCKLIAAFSPYIFPADRDPNSHANKASANMALKLWVIKANKRLMG
jgi:hypothetical protein